MLTLLQQRLIALISELSEADGFALAGGAALVLRGEVDRATNDLDLFSTDQAAVRGLGAAINAAATAAGWRCDVLRETDTGFVELEIGDGEAICRVDVAYDTRIRHSERLGAVNVLALEELAADKVLALYGRAQARDFIDVAALVRRFGWPRLYELAAEKDLGFHKRMFLGALRAFDRLPAAEFDLPTGDHAELRGEVLGWRAQLEQDLARDHDRGIDR